MKHDGNLHVRIQQSFIDRLNKHCEDNEKDRSKWIRNCLERELDTSIKAVEYINEVMEKNK